MPYMAVGSRQILYSASLTPALPGSESAQIATMNDNPDGSASAPAVSESLPVEASPETASAASSGSGVSTIESSPIGSRADFSA